MSRSISACLPTFVVSFPLARYILTRERIDIVHAHQATSPLGNEGLVYASTLGLASAYTDHSLFGLNDLASVVLNQILSATLSTVDACIAVSYTCRENLILRAKLDPHNSNCCLVPIGYRKWIDFLVPFLPAICQSFPHVDFIIGGDGPKRLALEEIVERHQLQDCVEFIGAVPNSQVWSVLQLNGKLFYSHLKGGKLWFDRC